MSDVTYAVVTYVDTDDVGNLATAWGQLFDSQGGAIGLAGALDLRVPVFYVGELLVLDGSGREVCGKGRKPSKWGVRCDEFDSIDEAVARAVAVTHASVQSEGGDE